MLSNITNDNVASLKEIPNHAASKDLFEKSKKHYEEFTEIQKIRDSFSINDENPRNAKHGALQPTFAYST